MKRQILAATLLGLSLISGGCSAVVSRALDSTSSATEAQAVTPTLVPIVSADGRVQLTAPDNWKVKELSESDRKRHLVMTLTSNQGAIELSLLALPKRKGLTLEVFQTAVSTAVEAVVGEAGTINKTSLDKLGGLPALQYEGWGSFGDLPVRVQATGVETPDAYYNIMVIGDPGVFALLQTNVEQIVKSFEIKASQ